MTLRKWLLLPALGVVALSLLACNGDDGADEPEGTETPTRAAGFQASPPSALKSYAYDVNVALSPDALDMSDAPTGLDFGDEDLSFVISGEVMNPDREHTTTTANLGFLSLTLESIRVGAEEWTKQDNGDWEPSTPGSDPLGAFMGDTDFSPGSIFTTDEGYSFEDLTQRLDAHGWTDEEVDGQDARHFTFTEEEFYQVFQTDREVLPAEIDATIVADLWLSEALGVPLKMTIVGSDPEGATLLEIEMTLTRINDDFEVEPPV